MDTAKTMGTHFLGGEDAAEWGKKNSETRSAFASLSLSSGPYTMNPSALSNLAAAELRVSDINNRQAAILPTCKDGGWEDVDDPRAFDDEQSGKTQRIRSKLTGNIIQGRSQRALRQTEPVSTAIQKVIVPGTGSSLSLGQAQKDAQGQYAEEVLNLNSTSASLTVDTRKPNNECAVDLKIAEAQKTARLAKLAIRKQKRIAARAESTAAIETAGAVNLPSKKRNKRAKRAAAATGAMTLPSKKKDKKKDKKAATVARDVSPKPKIPKLEAVWKTLGGYNSIPSAPTYIPFKLQHALLTTTQALLEQSCYYFTRKWIPSLLEDIGHRTPEAVELNHWWKVLKGRQVPIEAVNSEATQPLAKVFSRIDHIRHCAVHRLSRIPIMKLQAMIQDALTITLALRDDARAAQIQGWLGRLENIVVKDADIRKVEVEKQLQAIEEQQKEVVKRYVELENEAMRTSKLLAELNAQRQTEVIDAEVLLSLERDFNISAPEGDLVQKQVSAHATDRMIVLEDIGKPIGLQFLDLGGTDSSNIPAPRKNADIPGQALEYCLSQGLRTDEEVMDYLKNPVRVPKPDTDKGALDDNDPIVDLEDEESFTEEREPRKRRKILSGGSINYEGQRRVTRSRVGIGIPYEGLRRITRSMVQKVTE